MFNGCDFVIIKSFLPQPVQSPIKIEQNNKGNNNPFLYNPFESRISKEPLKWVKNEKNLLKITLYNSLKLSISMSKISLQDENNNFPFIIEPISPITLSSESVFNYYYYYLLFFVFLGNYNHVDCNSNT